MLGVGREPENLSKKLAKRLKDHPNFGDDNYHSHKLRCGGPADFQGDEKDIIIAMLTSKVLLNNITISRWEQAVNVAVSRSRERFHLFHQLRREDMKCVDSDPRRKLIEYCEKTSRAYSARRREAELDSLEGFASDVKDILQASGIEVRSCDEILSPDWNNKMLVVEGARRMVAIVLNGSERQTFDLWRVESQKWMVLSRVDWRVVECWRFQYIQSREAFISGLTRILFEEEGVRRPEKLKPPELHCDATKPYVNKISVRITAEPGATVVYSVDGSKPTVEYNQPIICSIGETQIRAYCMRCGDADSDIVEDVFQVVGRVELPDITPEGEGPYTDSLRVFISSRTQGAVICYTIDGSPPAGHSHQVCGTEGFELRCDAAPRIVHVRALGVLKEGSLAESEEASRRFELLPSTCEPEILPPALCPRADTVAVRVSCKTPDAVIRYKTSIADTELSPWSRYDPSTGILINRNGVVITAHARAPGRAESRPVSSAAIVVRACRPLFQPNGGILLDSDRILISCDTEGGIIRYRIEGPDLTTEWSVYQSPVSLTTTGAVIRAVAHRDGLEDSEESVSHRFVVRARPPSFEPSGGSFEDQAVVTIRCRRGSGDAKAAAGGPAPAPGTVVHCTIDGAPPEGSPTLFHDGSQIVVSRDGTVLRACAVKAGLERSEEVRSAAFQIRAQRPAFEPNGGDFQGPTAVKILYSRAAESGVIIRYTLDGSTPSRGSAEYDDASPVIVADSDTIVRAVAYVPGKQESVTASSLRFFIRARPVPLAASMPSPAASVAPVPAKRKDAAVPGAAGGGAAAAAPHHTDAAEPSPSKRPRLTDQPGHPAAGSLGASPYSCATQETLQAGSDSDAFEQSTIQPGESTQVYSPAAQDSPVLTLDFGGDDFAAPEFAGRAASADGSSVAAPRSGRALDPSGAILLRYERAAGEPVVEPGEWVMGGGQQLFEIGRSLASDLRVHESIAFVSRRHCVLRRNSDGVTLENIAKKSVFILGADGADAEVEPGKTSRRALRCGDVVALQRRADGGLGHRIRVQNAAPPDRGRAPVQQRTPRPEFEPDGGEHDGAVAVAVRCGAAGAAIHYTLDGSPATPESARCDGPVLVRADGVCLRAVAVADGMLPSDEARSQQFRCAPPPPCLIDYRRRERSAVVDPSRCPA